MSFGNLLVRLLLVALLPAIAAVIYVKGQNYDPALIDFKRMKATPSSVPSASSPSQPLVPDTVRAVQERPASPTAEVAGFRQAGRERQFTKDNLYEHVNGHAEYFIAAGFRGLTVTEYGSDRAEPVKPEIRAEVYDMGRAIQAFGVLTDESGDAPSPAPVGALGYRTSGGMGFIKGRYYVKLEALAKGAPLLPFAKAFARTITAEADDFSRSFSRFPSIGTTTSTKFAREGYRGLDFLHNVIERQYSVDGTKVTVALFAAGAGDIRRLTSAFMEYFTKSRIPYEKLGAKTGEGYTVLDKYEGNWFLISTGDSLFGIFGTDNQDVLKFFGMQN